MMNSSTRHKRCFNLHDSLVPLVAVLLSFLTFGLEEVF